MAHGVINATNITGVVEEHEDRLDNLSAAVEELAGLLDELDTRTRGKKERDEEFLEGIQSVVGYVNAYTSRVHDENMVHQEKKDRQY